MIIAVIIYFIQSLLWLTTGIKTGDWGCSMFLMVSEGFLLLLVSLINFRYDLIKAIREGAKTDEN